LQFVGGECEGAAEAGSSRCEAAWMGMERGTLHWAAARMPLATDAIAGRCGRPGRVWATESAAAITGVGRAVTVAGWRAATVGKSVEGRAAMRRAGCGAGGSDAVSRAV